MIRIQPEEITGSVFDRIGQQWMLVTAENPENGKINTMTASWGGFGVLWNTPVSFSFVRPQRYTFEFMEAAEKYSLSFLPESYRKALQLCGTKSGRDIDKIAAAGLTPVKLESGVWSFAEAECIVECRKRYGDFLKPENFMGTETIDQWYPKKDFHKVYVGEITGCYTAIDDKGSGS